MTRRLCPDEGKAHLANLRSHSEPAVPGLDYPPAPRFVQFETNAACNAQCPFCPQSHDARASATMSDSLWRKALDETRGLGVTYRPFMVNESLTDVRMVEIVRYVKRDGGASAEIHTTAALLADVRAQADDIDSGVHVVRLSIDGFFSSRYRTSRVGLDYDSVVRNAKDFIDLRNAGSYATRVEVRFR